MLEMVSRLRGRRSSISCVVDDAVLVRMLVRLRSVSVVPPQIPNRSVAVSAWKRHSEITGQSAQSCLAVASRSSRAD